MVRNEKTEKKSHGYVVDVPDTIIADAPTTKQRV